MAKELSKIEERYYEQAVCAQCGNRFSDSRDAERHLHDLHPPMPLLARTDQIILKGFGAFYDGKLMTLADIYYDKRKQTYTLALEWVDKPK